ncbi:PAS domain S-box protein [Roseomonas soli]|uniref:PAS domain S-box protein n=2 Tax=Neoroseomonas soli TaxID=1081025 RepID=A0A9X9X1M3_9PROT|nr:PAS domain S-box protein [Neoroseomonas soli]
MTAAELDALRDAILASPADAIVVCDRGGVIRFWNPGAERIFGFAAAEALGKSLDIIIPEAQRARHWEGFDRVMATGRTRYGEGDLLAVPALHRDGRRISVEFTIVPLHDAGGSMAGMVAILRDVTTRFEEMRTLRRRLAAVAGMEGAR